MHGEDGDEEDEVSLFTCGASCNEVEQPSIVGGGGIRDDGLEEDDTSSLSASYHPRGNSAAGTAASHRRSSHHRRRSKAPLTPKQKRRALLRKYNWTMPSPSEEQCYLDILLAYNYLRQIENIPAKHVVLYGKSVGSGPTCWLAQRSCQRSVDTGAGGTRTAATATATGGRMMSTPGGNAYDDVRDDMNISMRDRHCDDDERGADEYGSGRATLGGRSGDEAPGGVVLHSPFLSVIRVVLDMGFTTIGDLFPNIDRVKDFT
jgi:hypothetical protein